MTLKTLGRIAIGLLLAAILTTLLGGLFGCSRSTSTEPPQPTMHAKHKVQFVAWVGVYEFKTTEGVDCVVYYNGGITCNWEKYNAASQK